ncbi:probable disease resistance protein RF45 [Solanum stenotomum]|uniref:probable disease resistance protein RF45 n=1 Tax=Solanum stenotomum TaxID=172797 RepID=UPI0020D18546|nr:probable disease resistance protein RF45 [Solanum stenotomum]
MANEALKFFVENLLQLLSENVVLIKGVEDEFKNLLEEVQRLKAFVDDGAKFHSDNIVWDQLVKDIQKMIHKAEDVIDKFLVQAKLHREEKKVGRFFDVSRLKTITSLADEIKGISDKVKKLREESKHSFQPRPILEHPKRGHEITQVC